MFPISIPTNNFSLQMSCKYKEQQNAILIFVLFLHILHCKITVMDIRSQQNLIARNAPTLGCFAVDSLSHKFCSVHHLFQVMDLFPMSGDEVFLQLLQLLQFFLFSVYRRFMQSHFSFGQHSQNIPEN